MQYKQDLEKIRKWCIRRKLDGIGGWKVIDIFKHIHIFLKIIESVNREN
jgi:hypothetical protein